MTSRHSWSEPNRFHDNRGNITKSERSCLHCGIVKVTRHEIDELGRGVHWAEFWRGIDRIETDKTPVCERVEVEA
jgi:hypothetical protein